MASIGFVLLISGLTMQFLTPDRVFNNNLIGGLGILFIGIGIGRVFRYRTALKDPALARTIAAEEKDERTILIRAKAGNRGFWVGIVLGYILLMWEAISSYGGLPEINNDLMCYLLAGLVVLPFLVYAISYIIEESRV